MVINSGTYDFFLSNSDCLLEAFDRCDMRPSMLTAEHMISAKRSLNLELQAWSNRGINLWTVDLQVVPLLEGVSVYNVPTDTVTTLDVYLRTYQLSNTFNESVDFSTVSGSPTVTIVVADNALLPNLWLNIVTPVSVGGIVLQGFYQVATVIDSNTFTITASDNATSTVNNGGAVPLFSTTSSSSNVTVTLANHGLLAGELFNIGVETSVGGITLLGSYQVQSVTDSNNFVIDGLMEAASTTTGYENDGDLNMQTQAEDVSPIDRILSPIGRTDYAQMPNKEQVGFPTVYWFDRTINPTITLWQPPNQNGPYELRYYRMRQIQDSSPTMGQSSEVPLRFLDALCAGMAYRLATKYAKPLVPLLKEQAMMAFMEAQTEDRERAPIYITPNVSPYWRM